MKLIITLFSFLFTLSVFAQTTETELDPVTVSASLHAQPSSATGRNIVIIRGEQFNNLPVHSIDELLRYLPGVEVQQRGPMGSQSDIVIRGGTFQQVLIVMDGVRLNDPITGHFNSYIPVSPIEIERIEIVKGASSAIYGSEAVGGVINIVTKSFALKKNNKKMEALASATGGQYSLINANIGGHYQSNNTAVSGGILTNNSDGQLQRGTRGFFNNNTLSFSASHYFNDNWQLSLRSSFDNRSFGAQNFYTTYVSDTATEEVSTWWNQLQLAYRKENNKVNINAGYKEVRDQYSFSSVSTPNDNKSRLFQALTTFEHDFNSKTALVTGAQFQNRIIRSNDRGNHNVEQAAGFIILNQSLCKGLFASPALRLDWDESGGTELVPQINLSYKINKLQLRSSAGKTIRYADFTERYNNYNKVLVTSGSIGNPNLEAERSFSYEAGGDYFFKNDLKLSATAFRRDQKNVIDWTPTPYNQMPRKDNLSPAGNYALASNIAVVNTSGLETDLQYCIHLKKHHIIWATMGVTWLDSKTSEKTPSFYISSHAKFLGNFNLQYTNKHFSLAINGVYKHRTPQQATAINAEIDANCFMMNAKADVFLWKQRLSVFAGVDNVFDNKCGDLLGALLPGRWLMGGVKLMFSR